MTDSDRILALYFRGRTNAQIAGELGFTKNKVQHVLKRRGLKAIEPQQGRRRIPVGQLSRFDRFAWLETSEGWGG